MALDHARTAVLHESYEYIVYSEASPIMAIDPGTRKARSLPQDLRQRPITHYRARAGLSVHEYIVVFLKRCVYFRAIEDGSRSQVS